MTSSAKYAPGGMELKIPARDLRDALRHAGQASWRWRRSWRAAARASRGWTSSSTASTCCVNELNTMPGFTPTSVYAKLLDASGVALPASCSIASAGWRWSATQRAARATASELAARLT